MSTIRLVASDPPTMLIDLEENAPVDVDCCCRPPPGSCLLPDADCPHALCVTVRFDENDVSSKDFVEFIDSGNYFGVAAYAYDNSPDPSHVIEIYSWGTGGYLDIPIPNDQFFNTDLRLSITISVIDSTTAQVEVSIDGFGSGSFTMDAPNLPTDIINVGAISGGTGAHRTIKSVDVIPNPGSGETVFSFPNDSFDSFSGGASILDGVLRIDDDSGDAYALKTFDTPYNLGCLPPPATGACCSYYLGHGSCYESYEMDCVDATYLGDGIPCSPDPCNCPSELIYSIFEVQLRIYGYVIMGMCDSSCEEFGTALWVDFTVNFNDNGYVHGYASGTFDKTAYPCGAGDLFLQAYPYCKASSICSHGDAWEVELFMNSFYCTTFPDSNHCAGTDPYGESMEVIIYDTGCSFNATYVTLQPDIYPFPHGIYSGTTYMTQQMNTGGPCQTSPPGSEGSIAIDWQITIAP